jgi:hypothetical protein
LAPPAQAPVQVPGGLVRLHGVHAGSVGCVVVPVFRCREPSWRRGRWQKDVVPTRTPLLFRCRHGLFHLAAFPMGLRIHVEGSAPATHSATMLEPSLPPCLDLHNVDSERRKLRLSMATG